MARSLERRLARLQAQRTNAMPRMLGWQDTRDGTDADTVQLCAIGGGGERMTLDEWQRRYPNGLLIRVVYGDVDATKQEPRQMHAPGMAAPYADRLRELDAERRQFEQPANVG